MPTLPGFDSTIALLRTNRHSENILNLRHILDHHHPTHSTGAGAPRNIPAVLKSSSIAPQAVGCVLAAIDLRYSGYVNTAKTHRYHIRFIRNIFGALRRSMRYRL
jgi:hypothetical protein